MISAVLRVVLQHKDRRVIPVRTVRHRLHDPPDREIIVGNRCIRRRHARSRTRSVIVGQPQQHELRQLLAAAGLARLHEAGKLAQKFIGAQLIGIVEFEVGISRIEVPLELRLGRRVVRDQRNRVLVGTLAAAEVRWQRLPRLYFSARTRRRLRGRRATGWWNALRRVGTPRCGNELAIVAIESVCAAPNSPTGIPLPARSRRESPAFIGI